MHLDFKTLLPPSVLQDPCATAEMLPSSAMMRVNFIPGVRQRLGWRGMRECPKHRTCLTAKIKDMTGVFGFAPLPQSEDKKEEGKSTFALCYFPAPDEELFNAYSVEAELLALAPDYLEKIRDFPSYPEMLFLFQVGTVECIVDADNSVSLVLTAATRDVVIAADGYSVRAPEGARQVVAPGEVDKDLPAYEIAFKFFEILSASITFSLNLAPVGLKQVQLNNARTIYNKAGNVHRELSPDSYRRALRIDWGDSPQWSLANNRKIFDPISWNDPDPKPEIFENALWWEPAVPGARHSIDKSTMGISEKPKLILLTGFLGSGKTSFLARFIEYQASRNLFVAVVQNEIGEVGLDAKLLGQHYAVAEIDEGCVCCTLVGNLGGALREISSHYQPDFVVVETTGLANPANLLSELYELEDQLELSSVTCIVDALNVQDQLSQYAILKDQIRLADTVLLNKSDLVDKQKLAGINVELMALNPYMELRETCHGDISPAEIYGVNFQRKAVKAEHDQCSCKSHGLHSCKTHGHYGITSELWRVPQPVGEGALQTAFKQLHSSVLRVKGIVELVGGKRMVCQYVPGCLNLSEYTEQENEQPFLIFIGEKIDQAITGFEEALQ